MLRKISAWVLLALTCYTASSNAQDYTTGNLINPAAWAGTNYGNLPGDCCTGGPMPLYNNQLGGGGISFSYGRATVSQDININQAISGSGVVVKGYNYHWHITTNSANGVDPVQGNVSLFSNTNALLERFTYNYTAPMNETIFSGTQNFSTNYSLAAVSNLNVSFTGQDQGFWGGYYGPKVNHIVVSLNYGVDQCASNPLYSTQCSGYAQAYLTLQCSSNPLYSTSCPGYAQAYQDQQCASNPLFSMSCAGYQVAYLSQQCSSNQLFSTSCPGYQTAYATKMALENQKKAATETAAASPTTTATTSDSSSSGSSSGSTTASSGSTTVAVGGTVTDVTSTNAEVKLDLGGATVSTTGEIKPADNIPDVARATTASSTTTGETMTANVQEKEKKTSNVNALSIARNAVAATEAIARTVASDSAKMSYSENSNPSDGMGLSLGATGLGFSIPGLNAAQNYGQQTDTVVQKTYAYVAPVQEQVYVAPVQETFFTPKQNASNNAQGMEMPALPNNSQSSSSAFDMKQNSIAMMQEQRQETNSTVKNKGEVSELAGGVDIKTLAAAPVGYDLYLMSSLRDNPFYAPKDIYKNQNNVDNVRALRQMSSDSLHQQMINLQYK
ncbi:hypothetical protein UFOVP242_40 [uncultured Caudovirales phage]|uniref:Uncharacterized protein n=1 Tax=uncultured Caudovirales phage TaxID=2100421 RepID=A0A6J7WUF5_9CAUD|nr:hypothetical protein UFOVP242_40 [uncultured Caudovirales phage]